MKKIPSLHDHISELVDRFGTVAVESELRKFNDNELENRVCTILVNQGLHSFPEHLYRGDLFVVYEGSVDFSSTEALNEFVSQRLLSLKDFLVKKKWKQINIIISGHAAVCMQVKLAVYRITHVETTDWVFDGNGNYTPLQISMRKLLSSKPSADV